MKFPRTPHLPGSKSTSDDVSVPAGFGWDDEVIATEKMDGSNILINRKKFITRSGKVSGADWTWPVRTIQQSHGVNLPKGVWLAGELLYWRKSISYENLPGHFLVFGAIRGNVVLSWDNTVELAESVGLPLVNVLAGPGNDSEVLKSARSQVNESVEGFVVRPFGAFPLPEYEKFVGKWVGSHHTPVSTNNGINGFLSD